MAAGVEGALEVEHVGMLLGVDVVVGEVDGDIFDLELHRLRRRWAEARRDWRR